jgi:hypothetical protein
MKTYIKTEIRDETRFRVPVQNGRRTTAQKQASLLKRIININIDGRVEIARRVSLPLPMPMPAC